ncbi:MAG: hypothetical protein ACTSQ5_14535, partial [Promethearchaeota archaeon]
ENSSEYNVILDIVKLDPDYVLSDEENKLFWNYQALYWISLIFESSMRLIIPIALLILSTGKIYSSYYEDEDAPSSWIISITKPFNSGKRAITSLFLIIFGSILITIGIIAFVFPGFGSILITIGIIAFVFPGILIILFGMFSIHSLVIDEKEGMDTIRGGIFYVRGQFPKLILILLISIFIPMYIQSLYLDPLKILFGLTEEKFLLWINPTTHNYGMLYIYNFVDLFFRNILYFFVPIIYTVTFVQIRDGKLGFISSKQKNGKISKKNSKNVILIEIEKNQNHFNCPNCNKKLPSSARKCFKCKQLFDIKFK